MIELTADEARVIGVLIEKAQTTPDQYPLTINAVVNGANQKNNRDPVTSIDDGAALSALIGLRNKGLVVQQDAPGQRAPRFRHQFKEGLGVNTPEMVVLAELLLRGPQTLGELRGRASRMHPIESLDMAKNIVQQLMDKPEPLVKQIAPAPGSRAERYVQLLCPELHEIVEAAESPVEQSQGGTTSGAAAAAAAATIGQRVAQLESELATLRAAMSKLAAEIGATDPFAHREGEAPSEPSSSSGQPS
jgi:uncharacterized protein YceH (UPF0502 family)